MNEPRKRSPVAPSISLKESLEKALILYDKGAKYDCTIDSAARLIGYSGAKNGRALSILATLRQFGLTDRPKEGFVRVSKDVERYKFSPSDDLKKSILLGWLKTPKVFNDLLEKFNEGLPDHDIIKYELIQNEFSPESAEACVRCFLESVEFAGFKSASVSNDEALVPVSRYESAEEREYAETTAPRGGNKGQQDASPSSGERYPVRLPGGRRAWLEIPTPFYEKDKELIKSQIDLIITDEESK